MLLGGDERRYLGVFAPSAIPFPATNCLSPDVGFVHFCVKRIIILQDIIPSDSSVRDGRLP